MDQKLSIYTRVFKRSFDIIVSLIGILVLSPMFIIIFLFLIITTQKMPFFFQKRPGKHEKIFTVIKFKTMNDNTDKNGNLLPDQARLTRFGTFIRKTSLDEIPQLINVLKGDMSIVGPRPLLPEYIPLYNEEQKKRHHIKPGITGWAQVNGRNAIRWQKKLEYDVWYVHNLSFLLDVKIIGITILRVLKPEGVTSENSITSTKFTGDN